MARAGAKTGLKSYEGGKNFLFGKNKTNNQVDINLIIGVKLWGIMHFRRVPKFLFCYSKTTIKVNKGQKYVNVLQEHGRTFCFQIQSKSI